MTSTISYDAQQVPTMQGGGTLAALLLGHQHSSEPVAKADISK